MEKERIGVKLIKAGSIPWANITDTDMQIKRLYTEGTISKITMVRFDPGGSGAWVYDFVEILYVLKGEITLYWSNKEVVAKVGDMVCIEPTENPYVIRWENTGKEPVEIFVALEPYGIERARGGITPERFKEIAKLM